MAKLTVFNSVSPLTKKYWVDGRSEGSPPFWKGTFEVKDVNGHDDLKTLILSLEPNQALSYATPLELTSGTIVTDGNEIDEQGVISRTKKYFDYRNGEGWLFIDHDHTWSEEVVVSRLAELYPPFGTVTYVYATSASHGINGKQGFHLYFKVEDISIVNQAMCNLFDSAFNAGYGWCKVGKSGVYDRTFFDKAIYIPTGLDFIAGPICVPPLETPPRDIRVIQKGNDTLDLVPLLASVDAFKMKRVARLKVSEEAEGIIIKVAKERGIPDSEYRALIHGGVLHPGIKLLTIDCSEIDVAEILKISMEAYLKDDELEDIAIQHPIEQGLEEKTVLFYNAAAGVPRIHTFAHGGKIWNLKDDGTVIEELSRLYPDKQHLIENLRVAHGLTDHPEEAKILPTHADTYAVLHMMIKTFLMDPNYGSERLLIEQWGEMISLFLHLIDGHKGRFSIELPPSHGKTQVILHVILWLYQSKRIVPTSLSMFRIEDIEQNKQWLLERMERQWNTWRLSEQMSFPYTPTSYLKVRHSNERTSFEDLDKAPVIIHTHHVVRRNDFKERFFTYNGEERHLFIFDEAMYRSLLISEDALKSIDHLNKTISRIEMMVVGGLPETWLKNFRSKLVTAFERLRNIATIEQVIIEMTTLPESYITSGYRLDDGETKNFILNLLNIGAAEDAKFIVHRAQGGKGRGEKGGKVLFACKENDIHKLPRVINTDATRSVRTIHEFSQDCLKYPIEPYGGDEGVTFWIAPFKKTGKDDVAKDMTLHLLVVNEWLAKIKPKKVLVITSKGTTLEGKLENTPVVITGEGLAIGGGGEDITVRLNHPNLKQIHWGQHKQTNDYRDCDAVIAMNYFRKRGYNYQHDIFGEYGGYVKLSPGVQKSVERGFVVDELLQGFCRGSMREGKSQNCLMFSPYSIDESVKLTHHLEKHIGPNDRTELFEFNPLISAIDPHYKTDEEDKAQLRKVRKDTVYSDPREKDWTNNIRKACRKRGVENIEEIVSLYLRDKRAAPDNVTPTVWLKDRMQTSTIGAEAGVGDDIINPDLLSI